MPRQEKHGVVKKPGYRTDWEKGGRGPSRKEYNAICKLITALKPSDPDSPQYHLWAHESTKLADYFLSENPKRFDRVRFLDQSGVKPID